MKAHYTDYTCHMLRNYCRMIADGHTVYSAADMLRTEAERKNWNACDEVWHEMNDTEREVAMALYVPPEEDFKKSLAAYSRKNNVTKDYVWGICNKIVRMVARKRGLI